MSGSGSEEEAIWTLRAKAVLRPQLSDPRTHLCFGCFGDSAAKEEDDEDAVRIRLVHINDVYIMDNLHLGSWCDVSQHMQRHKTCFLLTATCAIPEATLAEILRRSKTALTNSLCSKCCPKLLSSVDLELAPK